MILRTLLLFTKATGCLLFVRMGTRIILLLTALNALNYLDRYLLGSVLPIFEQELSLTKDQAGWLVSAFVPGYVIFSPIFGYLGDRLSRPRLMALGVLLWSFATIATGFVHNYYGLLFVRALVGVGEASFVTIAPGLIKDFVRDSIKVNSLLSIFFAAIPIGSALGYVTGGLFAEGFPRWAAFMVGGVPGILLIPWVMQIKDLSNRPVAKENFFSGIREILRIRALWFVIGGYALNALALNGVAPWVTSYGKEIGFSLSEISTAFGLILVLSGFCGTFLGGRLASRIAAKRASPESALILYAGWVSIISAPFLVFAFAAEAKSAFLILCFLAELLVFASVAPINTLIVTNAPPALVTQAQGFSILALNVLGALPAAPLVGYLSRQVGLPHAMQLLSVPLILSGIVWIIGKNSVRGQNE